MSSVQTDPTIRFQRVWHALMRAMGDGHRVQYNTNKAYIAAINRKMRVR